MTPRVLPHGLVPGTPAETAARRLHRRGHVWHPTAAGRRLFRAPLVFRNDHSGECTCLACVVKRGASK